MPLTVGQLIVNDCLPPEFRDYTRILDSGGLEELLQRIAKEKPEAYSEITKKLMDIGNDAAFDNGVTLRLSDCETGFDKRPFLKIVADAEKAIESDKSMTDAEKSKALGEVYGKVQASIEKQVFDSELKKRNQLALQVASKARGTKGQLASFVSTPGSFPDGSGNTVPMFIQHSFAEGLSPAEYWAGSYGTRTSVVQGKIATAKGGAFGKLLSQSANNQVVVEDDCGGVNGVPMPLSDDDNIGAVLAEAAGKYKPGTVITKSVLADLRKDKKLDEIVVRSPMTCGCKNGVCSKCAGIRETGGFPPIGYNLGTNAASAFAERITQGALNTKHCLVEGTLVRMADWSVKPIESIKIGDFVIGSDIKGNLVPVCVTDTFDNGLESCVRTIFRKTRGRSSTEDIVLESTSNHKVLGATSNVSCALSGKPLSPIRVGQKAKKFLAAIPNSFDDRGLVNEPLALLLGVLIGDGCYTKSVEKVHLSCSDQQEVEELNEYLAPMNLVVRRLKYHDGIYHSVSIAKDNGKDSLGNPVKNYLIKHGMYGKMAHDKDIPDVMYSWDNKSVAAFIGGFIAADGSVCMSSQGHGIVALASTSKPLLVHLKELLQVRFGIQVAAITKTNSVGAPITAVKDTYGVYQRKHDQYQFTITSCEMLERLYKHIRIPGKKQEKLQKIVEHERSKRRRCVRDNGLIRISQEDIGIRHVYDITVNNADHLFMLANGLIVSNSGRLASGSGQYQGFGMFTSMAKVPKSYPDKATLADIDGEVTEIKDAPQGGKYVMIDDGSGPKEHYVPTGYDVLVKPGDKLEAGDQLSDGVINPAELVKYKGIGEARRYWAQRFTQGIRDSGMKGNRRNAEVLAKTLINNVELEEEDAAGLPGDITTYNKWAFSFRPRPDTKMLKPDAAKGMFLEQPVLHYTIGTRITPSVIKTLSKFGQKSIFANPNRPAVTPFMQRVEDSNATRDDWVARLGTTYLKDRLVEDAQRGSVSHLHTTEPNPSLAKGVEFGTWGQPGSKNKSEEFTY